MNNYTREQVALWLESVSDPEIPVMTIKDMGILRDFELIDDESVKVIITPTYSGCPAMDLISMNIRMAMLGHGFKNIEIVSQLDPAWTTDWITPEGLIKMKNFGIAPPIRKSNTSKGLFEEDEVPCVRCGSHHTELISQYGATSCKSMYRCLDCKEPFEHFKCH